MINNDLEVVSDFLIRFYREEPDYVKATLRSLKTLRGQDEYKYKLANSFSRILEHPFPKGVLRDLVVLSTSRSVHNNKEAKEVLNRIYQDNILDMAIYFDDPRN